MEMEMREGSIKTRERERWGAILLSHLQWQRWQKKIKKGIKKDDRGGSGCAQDADKKTESAEAPMLTETREGSLKKRKGVLKTVAEAHKRLEMLSEELKLMESEAGTVN